MEISRRFPTVVSSSESSNDDGYQISGRYASQGTARKGRKASINATIRAHVLPLEASSSKGNKATAIAVSYGPTQVTVSGPQAIPVRDWRGPNGKDPGYAQREHMIDPLSQATWFHFEIKGCTKDAPPRCSVRDSMCRVPCKQRSSSLNESRG